MQEERSHWKCPMIAPTEGGQYMGHSDRSSHEENWMKRLVSESAAPKQRPFTSLFFVLFVLFVFVLFLIFRGRKVDKCTGIPYDSSQRPLRTSLRKQRLLISLWHDQIILYLAYGE